MNMIQVVVAQAPAASQETVDARVGLRVAACSRRKGERAPKFSDIELFGLGTGSGHVKWGM